jgi:hypothetical protein
VFYEQHRVDVLKKYDHFKIGKVAGAATGAQWEAVDAISKVPYAEPLAWQGFKSAYFNESHFRYRAAVRKFVQTELAPRAQQMEEGNIEPGLDVYQKMGKFGYLVSRIGPGPWMKQWPLPLPGGVKPAEFDYFHEMIAHEELYRLVRDGLVWWTCGCS